MFERPDNATEKPKRVIFLSVEGNCTEKQYFTYVNQHREQLGIDSVIRIETLSRLGCDTASDPSSVYNLLQEYRELHENGIIPKEVSDELQTAGITDYSEQFIESYLHGDIQLTKKQKNAFHHALQIVGIDLDYQKYLSECKGIENDDVFAVVIDRDKDESRPPEQLASLIELCKSKGYLFILSNPCFEFWLLLHLCDVKTVYSGNLEDIRNNVPVSARHTYVSKEVWSLAHHAKSISPKVFEENYLPNIKAAIERSGDFATDETKLIYEIGTNIPNLFEIMRS